MSNLIDYDTLTLEDLATLQRRVQEKLDIKRVLARHTSPISELPNHRWFTRLNGRKIERQTKEELLQELVKRYNAMDQGLYDEKPKVKKSKTPTIKSIFPDFLKYSKINVAKTTWSKYLTIYEKFIVNSSIAKMPIDTIKFKDASDFLYHCQLVMPEMKQRYWNNVKVVLNKIFQYAIANEYVSKNPFEMLKVNKNFFAPPTQTRDGDTVFTKEEQLKVCEIAESDAAEKQISLPLGIILLFNLGIRDGELCALKWKDIECNNDYHFIHIQREMITGIDDNGKTNGFEVVNHCKSLAGDRRIPLNSKVIKTLNLIKELNIKNNFPVNNEDYIFLRWDKNEIHFCSPRSFAPRLAKYCKKAGMEVQKSPHDVRRTVLTNLFEAGMPLKRVQVFAGHASLKQTMEYIRASDDDVDLMNYIETLSQTKENREPNIIRFPTHQHLNIFEQF